MIEIQIKSRTVENGDGKTWDFPSNVVVFDGEELSTDHAIVGSHTSRGIDTHSITLTPAGLKRFSNCRPSDFPDSVSRLLINNDKLDFEEGNIQLIVAATEDGVMLGLRTFFNGSRWKHPWSIREYNLAFRETVQKLGPEVVKRRTDRISVGSNLLYEFPCSDTDLELRDAATKFFPIMEELHQITVTTLASKIRNDALIASFQFPKEVSVPCEQYLLYFVQFLKDVGVEATADLQHDAGTLLFSVTPVSKDVALENIREALSAYLHLPSNPNIGMELVMVGDIQAQQLIANVQHFQGQVRLLNATIQLQNITLQQKDGIIQDQRFVINQQQKLLEENVIFTSFQGTSIQKGSEDREEIFDGLVTFTKAEKYGVEFSTAKALRLAKGLFAHNKPKAQLTEHPKQEED